MKCSKCCFETNEDYDFCPKCGERVSVSNEPRATLAEPVHPAKSFMWSVAIGGPLIAYIVHRKELKNSLLSFFWPMFGWTFLMNIPCKIADRLSTMREPEDFGMISLISLILWFANVFVIGKLGAKKIKEVVPEYPYSDYKKRERLGIVIGLIISVPFIFII